MLSLTEAIAIPSEVTLLSNMRHLDLSGVATPNDAWLVDAMEAMTGLRTLSLGSSEVPSASSTIPTQIGLLTAMESIFLKISLSGTIPTELGLLTDLVALDLSDNQELTGYVPSEVGALTNLSVVNFRRTMLSQQIPPEVCALGLEIRMSEKPLAYVYNVGDAVMDACK